MSALRWTAVVLCGGRSSRFRAADPSVRDKTRVRLGGGSVLDSALVGVPEDWSLVAVGEQRPIRRAAQWTRETPLLSGPLAALAAAIPLVSTTGFVLIAGDMPYAGRSAQVLAQALGAAGEGVDAVLATDPDGRTQPLLAAARTAAVRAALPREPANLPMRSLLKSLCYQQLPLDAAHTADIDTSGDLDRFNSR